MELIIQCNVNRTQQESDSAGSNRIVSQITVKEVAAMSLDHDAIFKAYPDAVTVDDGTGAFKADGSQITLVQSDIDAARTSLDTEAAKIAYQSVRQPLYPSLGDFADAMYWNSKGDSSKLEAYYAACEKVKTDNPKPS